MKFIKTNYIVRKIRGAALRVFNLIENNGSANFSKNGEEKFLIGLIKNYSEQNQKHAKVVFDIGANIGDYSGLILDMAEKNKLDIELHLFEPTKQCFQLLEKRFPNQSLILNNFGASNVTSMATIYYDKQKSGLASIYKRNLEHYDLSLDLEEEISLRRLDTYIHDNSINHVDFIKIDIEGHELSALEGLGEFLNGEFIDHIQFEYGGANLDSRTSLMDLYNYLETRGFVIAKIKKNGLEIRKYMPYMENFENANYVAISKRLINS